MMEASIRETIERLNELLEAERAGVETMSRLINEFAAERAGTFTWRYLEKGPEVWRVEIGRTGV